MSKKLNGKAKAIKNEKNGYITVRVANSNFYEYKALTSENVQVEVVEYMMMLSKKGIDYSYVVGYPTDGEPFLAVNKRFGNDWQEQGYFPELLEEAA